MNLDEQEAEWQPMIQGNIEQEHKELRIVKFLIRNMNCSDLFALNKLFISDNVLRIVVETNMPCNVTVAK